VRCLASQMARIGTPQFLSLRMAQLGRFYPESVYNVLGCHMLSVLDILVGLKDMNFEFRDLVRNPQGVVETGNMQFRRGELTGEVFVSLNTAERERRIQVIGDRGELVFTLLAGHTVRLSLSERCGTDAVVTASEYWDFDETNNINLMLDAFAERIRGISEPNVPLALSIAHILEGR